ncbi:MAG TPA: tetratricopeptide repeat protein [Terriglobales bacterium]|jgi:tetratricopeptide (TPR) repeat protein|nr:tetratricopeptide repeat protein [Terriglobales bacterium]
MSIPTFLRSVAFVLLCALAAHGGSAATTCTRQAGLEAKLRTHATSAAYVESGTWFEAQHKFECAARDFALAAKLDSHSASILLRLGNSLLSAGELGGAEAAFRQSISLSPGAAEAHGKLALVLERLHRREEAKAEWSAALKINPLAIFALDGMGKHLLEEGNYPAAIELLQSAPPDEALTLDLAQAYARAGSLPRAEGVLRKAAAANPSSFPLTKALVGVLVDEHSFERTFQEPAQIAEKFAAAHPHNIDAQRLHLALLVAWIPQGAQSGDVARATPLARKLLAARPEDSYFLYVNGMLERQAGDYKNARLHLEKSIAIDSSSDHAHYELGLVLAALNEAALAKREFEKSMSLGNAEPEVHFQLAKVLRTLGNADEAAQQFKLYNEQLDRTSKKRVAKLKEGQADDELSQGHIRNAIDLYRQAIDASADDPMLNFKLAMAFDKTGDTISEKAALEKAAQLDPDMAVAQNQLGYLASRSGDVASAEKYFRHAVEAAPAFAEAWVNLAATLGMESKIAEAQEAIASALQADPHNSAALELQQELRKQQP